MPPFCSVAPRDGKAEFLENTSVKSTRAPLDSLHSVKIENPKLENIKFIIFTVFMKTEPVKANLSLLKSDLSTSICYTYQHKNN